ncbi:30S ribosomal protein S2 [Candidatus Micrarchaeota archaeon RBG_16_49_10]|nr:MAG: 30S ribosomal protein S2 [Candidatus Micrarchaeota archaeon RBG_16_49_10]
MAEEETLIPKQEYLSAGIHIGMKSKTKDMEKFVYKVREDGLAVLNLKLLDERLGIAANFLAGMKRVLVVGRRPIVHEAIKKFSEATGNEYIKGRFMPGTLTNPNYSSFTEPDAVLITDPVTDKQALKEATDMRIPVVALVGTSNETRGIDFIVPCNNKGKKSLAIVYWVLAKEISKKRGKDFNYTLNDFIGEEEG